MKEIKKIKKSLLFYFNGNCGKVFPTDSDFIFTYLVPLDVNEKRGDLKKNLISFIKLHETL
jgi:hypothetical protein